MLIKRWDESLSTECTNEVAFSLSQWHLSQIQDRQSVVEIAGLLDRKDLRGLCHYNLSYTGLSPADYRHCRQILAFFQKRKDLDIGIDVESAAWEKFIDAESLCRETNEIFRKRYQGGFYFPLDVESILFKAQRKISAILGDLPSLADLRLRFGPGATTTVKKKEASIRRKLAQMFTCSEDAVESITDLLQELPLWVGLSDSSEESVTVPVQVHPGRIAFVPKNCKVKRTVLIEPMLNQLVQLGIGEIIAERLAKFGVDLKDQTKNQRLALEGSLTDALATLDLSSASDTIATLLVGDLLPLDWYEFLGQWRTSRATKGKVDDVMRLEKFSSMGNGFTFPLESLIFYALADACCETRWEHEKCNVYGDDIVIPSKHAPLLTKVLHCCGFSVNKEKSFVQGPFRESCGKDYLSGIDVRPSYLKDALSGQTCFVLHNYYIRTGQPEPAELLLKILDGSLHIFGPDGYGDGHLLGDFEPTPTQRELGWSGYTFDTFTYKSPKAYYRLGADYVFPAYSIYVKEASSPPVVDFRRFPRFHGKASHGSFRPERGEAVYAKIGNRSYLTDTLPGVKGYKRIKIYTLK